MRRPLPLWLAAVLPSTILGHALTYASSGRTAGDAQHAWVTPVLDVSLALAFAVATWLLGRVLVRARVVARRLMERHLLSLWPRIALLQVALFIAIERGEGASAGWYGCLVQVLVALLVAYAVTRFSRFLVVCSRAAEDASRYLERLGSLRGVFLRRERTAAAFALPMSAGHNRFGRAPPCSTFR